MLTTGKASNLKHWQSESLPPPLCFSVYIRHPASSLSKGFEDSAILNMYLSSIQFLKAAYLTKDWHSSCVGVRLLLGSLLLMPTLTANTENNCEGRQPEVNWCFKAHEYTSWILLSQKGPGLVVLNRFRCKALHKKCFLVYRDQMKDRNSVFLDYLSLQRLQA